MRLLDEDGHAVERSAGRADDDCDAVDADADYDAEHADDADADDAEHEHDRATTRTAPEPAFTQSESKAEGASGAAAVVRSHGYTPNDTSEYHSDQTLRVLVGTQSESSSGYGQQAFFFVDGHYLGTDTKLPSAKVKVLAQGDTEVTLGYPLYRRGDPLSSPSGGEAHVTFQLNNGKLVALQSPLATAVAANTAPSRQ